MSSEYQVLSTKKYSIPNTQYPILYGILFAYYGVTNDIKVKSSDLLQRYSLVVAWLVILAGLVGVFNFFGVDLVNTCLGLIGINLFLWLGSYVVNYEDGKTVFQLGYYLSIIFLIIVMSVFGGRMGFWNTFAMMRVMQVGVSGFLIFLVGLKSSIEDYLRYKLGIFSLGTISLVIVDQVHNFYIALTLNSLLLTGVYYRILNVLKHRPLSEEKKENISVRRILAGERITQVKKHFKSEFEKIIYRFIVEMPSRAKKLLELMNIVLIVALIYYYVANIASFANINHIFYWLIMIIFVTNVLLLKRIGYNSIIQNLIVFLVINFAIYISLFSYLNGDVGAIVSRAIIRNIVSASLIFYVHKVPMLAKIFTPIEYSYWLVATVAALVVNIILMRNTTLPGELIFFLVLLYIGLEGMILFYAAKYLQSKIV
ncbi:MAG: hypothetical protein NTX91_04750 [candidate division SR1 bacterium]|nr:hypothetical protein [candidate division SR1 bacterium]